VNKPRGVRLEGHAASVWDMSVYKVLAVNPEGNGLLGRFRFKWGIILK
jgi:hypothetical protein